MADAPTTEQIAQLWSEAVVEAFAENEPEMQVFARKLLSFQPPPPPSPRDAYQTSLRQIVAAWAPTVRHCEAYEFCDRRRPLVVKHRSGCAAWMQGRGQLWLAGDEATCNCGATAHIP